MICPKCGSGEVDVKMVQENQGSVTTTKTKSKYKEKKHGILWWLCIGWWWVIIDGIIWLFMFLPRLLIHATRKKQYVGESTSATATKNIVVYKNVCSCKSCGHIWETK